jgi:hypothetical protein
MLKRCSQEKETVARLLNTSGHYAPRFHDQEVHDLTPRAIQCDEQGSFVKKKQKHRNDDEARQAGDFWDHTAIAPDSKLIESSLCMKSVRSNLHGRPTRFDWRVGCTEHRYGQ